MTDDVRPGLRLWTLFRRRKLAYLLLEDYDRESEPFDFEGAMRKLEAFAATWDWPACKHEGYSSWREAVEAKAAQWPTK